MPVNTILPLLEILLFAIHTKIVNHFSQDCSVEPINVIVDFPLLNRAHNHKTHLSVFQQMLIYDPALRLMSKEALNHLYFADLDKSVLPAQT